MAERMLKFVGTPQAMPEKRAPAERRRDFQEIYAEYARGQAALRYILQELSQEGHVGYPEAGVKKKTQELTGISAEAPRAEAGA